MTSKDVIRRYARQAIKYARARDMQSAVTMIHLLRQMNNGASLKAAIDQTFPVSSRKQASADLVNIAQTPSDYAVSTRNKKRANPFSGIFGKPKLDLTTEAELQQRQDDKRRQQELAQETKRIQQELAQDTIRAQKTMNDRSIGAREWFNGQQIPKTLDNMAQSDDWAALWSHARDTYDIDNPDQKFKELLRLVNERKARDESQAYLDDFKKTIEAQGAVNDSGKNQGIVSEPKAEPSPPTKTTPAPAPKAEPKPTTPAPTTPTTPATPPPADTGTKTTPSSLSKWLQDNSTTVGTGGVAGLLGGAGGYMLTQDKDKKLRNALIAAILAGGAGAVGSHYLGKQKTV
jgi:hypothetical protein